MSNVVAIKAEARPRVGKGAAREVRRQGRVPAVIYGDKKTPEPISLDANELGKLLKTGKFLTTLFTIEVGGQETRAIPRDVHFDPVRDFAIHVDFLRLGENARIDVDVPVRFLNDQASPGIKRGGVLNIVRHEVELSCPADSIPDHLDVDLTGLDIGDSVHISAISLPEGVTPTITDRDFTIATIASPAGLKSEAEEKAEGETAGEGATAAAAPAKADDKDKEKKG